jgi:hypothetical protein
MNIFSKGADFMINEKIQANLDENYFIDTTEPVKNRNILGEEIEHKNQEYGHKNSKKQETKRNLTLQELIETKKSILFGQLTTGIFNAASAKPFLKLVSRSSREDLLRNKIKFLLRSESKKDLTKTLNENRNKNQSKIDLNLPQIRENKYSYLDLSSKEKIKVLNDLIKSGNIIENSRNNLYKENYYMLHENNNPHVNINDNIIVSKKILKKRKKHSNKYNQKQTDTIMLKTINEKNFNEINLIKVQFDFLLYNKDKIIFKFMIINM